MKKLTPKFIKGLGFKCYGTTKEEDFHYDLYALSKTSPLRIYFNYFNDGSEYTVEVLWRSEDELKNVGETELKMLLSILPI